MRDELLVEMEKQVFGHFVFDRNLLYACDPDDFATELAQNILIELKKYGEYEWSPDKIYYWLAVNPKSEIHRDAVNEIFGIDKPIGEYTFMMEEVRKEAIKRRMRDVIVDDVAKILESKDAIDPKLLEKAISTLTTGISKIENGGDYNLYRTGQLVEDYQATLNARKVGKGFWSTGCSHLDSMLTEGFAPQKITSIYAPSGIGKSSYALYLVNRQINLRIPSVYITLEMDRDSTMDRLISMRSKIPLKFFYKRNNDDYLENVKMIELALEREKNSLTKNPYFRLVDNPGLALKDVELIVEQAKREMNVNYLVCTIDLLSMVRDFNLGDGSTADKYEHAMNTLHEIARRTNCHFVGVFQAKRNAIPVTKEDDIEKLRPKIENIKNSGAIEERSRIIISLFRKKFYLSRYFPQSPNLDSMQDLMEVKIDKQNMGRLGVCQYFFEPESSYLCKWIEEPEIPPYNPEPEKVDGQAEIDTNS